AFVVAVPSLVVSSNTVTALLAAAVPVRDSVVALVMPSPTVPLSGENDVMAGALGATVSTVTAKADEAAPVLPAVSVSVAVKLWVAFDRVPVVKLQAPLPFTVAVPSWVAPSYTLTVLFASAAPVSVSVVALVMPSPTVPLSGENDVMAGALGATVSTVSTV